MVDEVLDLAAALAPLADGDGAGNDLRQDYSANSVYQRLRDARAEARAEERARDSQGGEEGGVPEGWRHVRRLGEQALASQSKDFEVACWLTEALVRQEGLRGLAAGAKLLARLVENFWEAGHPQPDEDGMEGRSAPMGGLAGGDNDGTLMQALRRHPLFRRPSGDDFSLYQYEASADTAALSDETRREQRHAQGVIPLETAEIEAKFDRPGLSRVAGQAAEARAAWGEFQAQLDARFGLDAPPTRRVAEVLDRMVEVANLLNGGVAPAAEAMAGAVEGAVMAAPAQGQGNVLGVPVAGGSLANREQALRTLEQLSEFFQKTEPHSFLAYTLADAARRGRLSLPELLAEVLSDDAARHGMLTALGIRPGTLEE
jgi:type VI secretion system protein ImpA